MDCSTERAGGYHAGQHHGEASDASIFEGLSLSEIAGFEALGVSKLEHLRFVRSKQIKSLGLRPEPRALVNKLMAQVR